MHRISRKLVAPKNWPNFEGKTQFEVISIVILNFNLFWWICSQQEHFRGVSFHTCSAVGAHAAIVHYTPTLETQKRITRDEIYLVDSGGQYLGKQFNEASRLENMNSICLFQSTHRRNDWCDANNSFGHTIAKGNRCIHTSTQGIHIIIDSYFPIESTRSYQHFVLYSSF